MLQTCDQSAQLRNLRVGYREIRNELAMQLRHRPMLWGPLAARHPLGPAHAARPPDARLHGSTHPVLKSR